MKTSKFLLCLLLLVGAASISTAQEKSVSEQMASTAMTSLWRDAGAPPRWTYEYGVVLKGLEGVWLSTGDGHYFSFIQKGLDNFVNADGTIRTYNAADYNLDNINTGRSLLSPKNAWMVPERAAVLREQLSTHPRTSDGVWHRKIYPSR
jgi:unsaturated rhamnogalacturonyl hydrolase